MSDDSKVVIEEASVKIRIIKLEKVEKYFSSNVTKGSVSKIKYKYSMYFRILAEK